MVKKTSSKKTTTTKKSSNITIRLYNDKDIFYSQKEENTAFAYMPGFIGNMFGAQQKILTSDICNPYGNYVFDIWSDKKSFTDKKNLFVVALNEKKLIIGVCLFIKESNFITLKALCIEKAYRNKGIAEKLLRKSFTFAEDKYGKNKTYLLLATKEGYKLYKKIGFRELSKAELDKYNDYLSNLMEFEDEIWLILNK